MCVGGGCDPVDVFRCVCVCGQVYVCLVSYVICGWSGLCVCVCVSERRKAHGYLRQMFCVVYAVY